MNLTKIKIGMAIFVAVACVSSALALTETVDGIAWTYTVNNGKATVGDGEYDSTAISKLASGAVTIPSKLGGYNVTSIGDYAFWQCKSLSSITIPYGVTSMGEFVFQGCTSLTNITMPNSITNIGRQAFCFCSGLTSVTIPDSVTSIGYNAFDSCGLQSILINDLSAWCRIKFRDYKSNPLYLEGRNLYLGGLLVKDLSIPNGVVDIGDFAFYGYKGLTSVTIPDSVMRIGNSAFAGCSGLKSMTIVNSVTNIGDSAFSGCSGLASVTIGSGVTSIGQSAFSGCSGLASVTIPNSVTSIGSSAFSGCRGITSVTIPNSVTSIGSSAFSNCSGLTSVTICSGVTSIGASMFSSCNGLTSVTIPNSVTSIGSSAFSSCSGLSIVTIPNSVTNIGANAFANCPMYEINLCRMAWGGSIAGGVQSGELPYALTNAPADRAIASVTVDGDRAIDDFVLKDGKVYDSVLYISNAVDRVVMLTLPAGYTYKTRRGARPLVIPESSQCILSITRLADRVFLVSREDLDTVE